MMAREIINEEHLDNVVGGWMHFNANTKILTYTHEETGEGPGRFIQFHAQIRDNGPGERKVQEKAPPRESHLGEARRGAVPYFV